jgi:hypothetical protein
MRTTIRFNKEEELKLKQIKQLINEDDTSKAIKFAMDWTLTHIKNVTQALISPEWDVIFQSKRKTQELKRKVYY